VSIYLVEISIIDDDPKSTPEKVRKDLERIFAGQIAWGHIDVKKAKIVVAG